MIFFFFSFLCPAAGQLSQSAHFSLQLPYTVLGLGRSANFLDHLFVGIPRPSSETVKKEKKIDDALKLLEAVWSVAVLQSDSFIVKRN